MESGFDMDNFDSVWRRVSADEMPMTTSAGETEEERLKRFMDDEARDASTYARMASRSSDSRRARLFRQMSSDESRHLRKLQTWYFILTGDTYAPKPGKPEMTSMLGLMRAQYKGELAGSKEYNDAARATKYERLAELYTENAADEASHAKQLEQMIEEIMR